MADAFKKKSAVSPAVSVGERPLLTPGSLECASLVAWNEILTRTESVAGEREKLSRGFQARVADEVARAQETYSGIRSRCKQTAAQLAKARDKSFSAAAQQKKKYDDACAALENQRAKADRSGSEKSRTRLAQRQAQMDEAKNAYIISLAVANRIKAKYYYRDLPELLDCLQALNETKVSRVNGLLLTASLLERRCNESMSTELQAADKLVSQNLPRLDTAMFVKHNAGGWQEPPDRQFEPSPIWHDDEQMKVDGGPQLEDLKHRLADSFAQYEKIAPQCADQRSHLRELVSARRTAIDGATKSVEIKSQSDYAKCDKLLGQSITTFEVFTDNDTRQVSCEAEIQTIEDATEGRDMTLATPVHTAKKSRFGLFRSHHKESKSTQGNGTGAGRARADSDLTSLSSSMSRMSLSEVTNVRCRLFSDGAQLPVSSSASSASLASAVARYAYSARGDDELTVAVGDKLNVTSADDGSGWTEVRSQDGSTGLVPTTYIEIHRARPAAPPSRAAARAAAGGATHARTAHPTVTALYAYEARGPDELSIARGDKITVTSPDDGSGWTEGELAGKRGLFPTSYAK